MARQLALNKHHDQGAGTGGPWQAQSGVNIGLAKNAFSLSDFPYLPCENMILFFHPNFVQTVSPPLPLGFIYQLFAIY